MIKYLPKWDVLAIKFSNELDKLEVTSSYPATVHYVSLNITALVQVSKICTSQLLKVVKITWVNIILRDTKYHPASACLYCFLSNKPFTIIETWYQFVSHLKIEYPH